MPHADPTLSVAERVDAACDRFESEWKTGRRPRIEDYLAAAPESDRAELRPALLAVELELQGRGEADTSVTRSSVRSDGRPTPVTTIDHIEGIEASRRVIGRFEIRGVLGAGAFGKVYRAFDPHLGREVAVKVPLESTVKTDAERAQFLKEARAAATINHPNVCQVHEVGEADGRPYIVMALVPGQSLADTLKARKGPLPEKQAALIARKIAVALAAAHDRGIVHRDLKPANVMFDRERKDIVVMDFGLARGPRFGDARGTQSGIVMGTPAYMSPEQARGESKEVGPAGDVFSLGVILYELLTGARPFSGTATEVIGQILHVDPEPPSQRRSGIDQRLEAICLKAMAKDPAARFATMKEFAAELEAVLRAPVPAAASAETARPDRTRGAADDPSTNATNLADVFAAMSMERKQARAETAAAVEAAVARHRTPRWGFVLVGLLLMGGLAAVAGIVFYTHSDKVKVTIELTDVDLSDKSLSFFLDEEPISAEALANPIELVPGEHVLVVKRGKAIVKRMLLTVSGGRSPGIKVKDITPPPGEKRLSPEEEDHDFAEWLLSIGAKATISVNAGPAITANKLSELPPGPLRVIGFDAWNNQELTDENSNPVIGWLRRSGADSVSFHGNPISDATVAKLVQIKTLKRIWLGGTKITDRSLELLATRPDLKSTGFDGTAVTDAGLVHLRGLTELDSLALFNTRITDEGVKHLAGLKNLRALNLGATRVSGTGLRLLKGLPIEELAIGGSWVRGADLDVLKEFASLRTLDAGDLSLTDAAVPALVELKDLKRLLVGNNRITDEGLQKFAGLKGLEELWVDLNPLTAAGLDKLRKALPGCRILPEKKTANDGFAPLFNGKDLTGWQPTPGSKADWRIEGGVIVAGSAAFNPGERSYLMTARDDYADFRLRIEAMLDATADSGAFVRLQPFTQQGVSGRERGYEVQMNCEVRDTNRTGGLSVAPPAGGPVLAHRQEQALAAAGEWFTLEIEARGARIATRVNGVVAADYTDPGRHFARGHIGLQYTRGLVKVRRIEVKELPPTENGFVPLFNGKDLTGWSTLNLNYTKNKTTSVWAADPERHVLAAVAGDFQELQSDRQFKDFTLRLEWRFTPGRSVGVNGSGIVVRSKGLNSTGPLAGADPQGIEIDLRPKSSQSDDKGMGTGCFTTFGTTLANHRGKTKEDTQRHLGWLKEPAIHYDGGWNYCEVTCQGDRIKVSMNGELINEGWDADQSAGLIVLRSQNTAVEFRNVRIKELAPPTENGFIPLFNGKDLTGWKTHPDQPGGWSVEDGFLTGRSTSANHLFSEAGDYGDFHLKAECRINRFGNSGIYFRTESEMKKRGNDILWPVGYEAQIIHEFPKPVSALTGCIRTVGEVLAPVANCDIKPNEWFSLDVIAKGRKLVVKVNGVETANIEDEEFTRGHIVLQACRDSVAQTDTLVQFRKIEIRRLGANE